MANPKGEDLLANFFTNKLKQCKDKIEVRQEGEYRNYYFDNHFEIGWRGTLESLPVGIDEITKEGIMNIGIRSITIGEGLTGLSGLRSIGELSDRGFV